MHPILFKIHIFGKEFIIATYGFCIAIGVLVGYYISIFIAKKYLKNAPEIISDMLFYALIPGFIGARIVYIISEWDNFIKSPLSYIFSRSGFVLYGGIIFGFIGFIYFCKKHNLKWQLLADLCAPGFGFAHFFGRLGCFFNGCCYGKACSKPFGVLFYQIYNNKLYPIGYHLPTQLIEASFALIMGIYLFIRSNRKNYVPNGKSAYIYLLAYSVFRFFIEFLRGDDRGFYIGIFSISQVISIILFIFLIAKKDFFILSKNEIHK